MTTPTHLKSAAARWSPRTWSALGGLLLILMSGFVFSAARQTATNPRANFYRAVRDGVSGYTAVASEAHKVLIQNGGQNWRRIRNGPLAGISPWLLAGVLFVIVLFYMVAGKDRLEAQPSGVSIDRYNLGERILHWYTAFFFVVMAVSGLSMLFGRAVIAPVFGLQANAAYLQAAKWAHNYSGPFFLVGLLVEIVVWFKANIPKGFDFTWWKNLGGMVGSGPRPPAEKINGGEKAWYWLMVLAAVGVGATGLILNFPNFGQSRLTMQVSHVIHVSVAVLFVAASFGHIYIGTIGAQGTFSGMWRGRVDAVWANQHANLWYRKKYGALGPEDQQRTPSPR